MLLVTLLAHMPAIQASEVMHARAQAQHLLNAADHYALPRLIAICERALISGLEVANAAHTLTLAEQHGARSLKVAALMFVVANVVEAMRTDGWAHMAESRPALLTEASICNADPPLSSSPIMCGLM